MVILECSLLLHGLTLPRIYNMSPHGHSMCCVLALVGMQVSLVLPVPLCSSKVGVAVDLDSRQILFGTNGVWAPAYGEEALAVGTIVIICRSLATNAKQSNLTVLLENT